MSAPQTLFDALRQKIEEVDAEVLRLVEAGHLNHGMSDEPGGPELNLPDDIRAKLLILGAAVNDYVFWIRQRQQEGDLSDRSEDQMWWAEEMEAGTGAWGVTPREALDHYLSDDLLDRRRWVDHRGLNLSYPDDVPSNRHA